MYTDGQLTLDLSEDYQVNLVSRMTNYNPASSASYDFGESCYAFFFVCVKYALQIMQPALS